MGSAYEPAMSTWICTCTIHVYTKYIKKITNVDKRELLSKLRFCR